MSVALALNKRRLGCVGRREVGVWDAQSASRCGREQGREPCLFAREGGAHRGEELPEGLWTAGAQLTELPAVEVN